MIAMVLVEFSVFPLGKGESVGDYVARCLKIVDAAAWNINATPWARPSKASWTRSWTW